MDYIFIFVIVFLWILIWWIFNIFFWYWKIPDLKKVTVTECVKELTDDKAKCVEDTIKSIQDNWVKKCVEWNIDQKSWLALDIKNSIIKDSEINDIDWLVKECMYYKTTQLAWQNSNNYPIFFNFLSSLAWSFVGNYIADSLFRRSNNYNLYNPTNGFWGYNYSPTNNTQRNNNLSNIENQYKSNSWNIKQMRESSSANSNYKLWDSWNNWSKNVLRNSSKSSSWSTKWSSSSSFWWSSSSKWSSLW